MEMILSMQHYGRGVANIPMPRALSRSPRKEWPVSPSLIIFVLAVLLILLLKLTTTSTQKLLKPAKTIIIIPQTKPAPEPTVPKSIPLIKVLKDAVKKTVASQKKELKKIIPKKVVPKKPLAKKIESKKIKPLAKLNKKIETKKITRDKIKPKPLALKKINAPKQLNKPIPENKILPKKIEPNVLTQKEIPAPKLPMQHDPKLAVKPNSRNFTPEPMIKARPQIADRAPAGNFSAIQGIERKTVVNVPSGQSPPRHLVKLDTVRSGPAPELTQWESYQKPAAANPLATNKRRNAHNVTVPDLLSPVHHVAPASGGPEAENLVIINSSRIGNSDRVKTLKRDIMKKAGKMNPAHSPYRYKIKNYTCTLTVEGGDQGKIIIDFTPADAPFDVVSALERLLPR